MPYPSVDLLVTAADHLRGRHPLTVITIPALLRAGTQAGIPPTELVPFGSAQERPVLESFKVADGRKPYLAVWGDPSQLVNHDYPGSTLQRLRTQDILGRSILIDDAGPTPSRRRTKFALRPDAGATLASRQPLVDRASLAVWLGRNQEFDDLEQIVAWFDETYPLNGTDLEHFYIRAVPDDLRSISIPFANTPAEGMELLERVTLRQVEEPTSPSREDPAARTDAIEGLGWTREVCGYPLQEVDPGRITSRVLDDLHDSHIELPDASSLVRRCVMALLVGHLILQGPPGTGKTTLARALARGFRSELKERTATSDWSPYHVVGGLRPNLEGGFSPTYGVVAEAALLCARVVRRAANAEAGEGAPSATAPMQAAWLFVDEFNRADIDKAIGSLYTMLSSCDPDHLIQTPIDLWFEATPDTRRLWVPARFRIIGAMNDLDTSFVTRMSQGLTRRFHFVTVGIPSRVEGERAVTSEVETAFVGAHTWLDRTYGASLAVSTVDGARAALTELLETLQKLVDGLRYPSVGAGWPVGTAQVVDILRMVLIHHATQTSATGAEVLDFAVADRLVPQMASIADEQSEYFLGVLRDLGLASAAAALAHLLDPHSTT